MTAVQATPDASSVAERELVIHRDFDFPRDLVFQAWTDPAQLPHWFGPHGFTVTSHSADMRVGGMWRYTMHGPDGTDYPSRMVYQVIDRPERLVYLHGEDVDDDPGVFEVTISFDDLGGGRTRVTNRALFRTAAQRKGVESFGAARLGQQTFDRLAAHLASIA